jgi:RNA polymerase sigma factor (sigma-70 family)
MALLTPARTPYEEHRDYVLAVLGRRCRWLDPSDREALLHDAYAVLLEKQRTGSLDLATMRAPQVRAYLTQTALNKAMDEGKRAARRRSVSLDDEQLGLDPPDPQRALDERLASSFDDARVREIVAELPERQQTVIKLRFFFNRTPGEIQRYLGITERVYRRELERATRHLAQRYQLVREGSFCESRRSLILAYVTGVAGPTRVAEARRHLETCPGCASMAADLHATMRQIAALVPAPALAVPAAHGLIAHWAARGRMRAVDVASATRDHALQTFARVEPSKAAALSNLRPGAAAALVAGCLAAGSTATYCIVQGVPAPLRSLVGATGPARHRDRATTSRPTHARHAARHAQAAAIAPVLPPPPTRPVSRPARTPTRVRRETRGVRPSAGGAGARAQRVHLATSPEFGVGGGSPVSSAPATPSSRAAGSAPPPKPSTPLPEFDP